RRLCARARTLSGGEQQMLVLAQALVSQPRYILIDELSLGLAPVVVNRLVPRIRAFAESGIGVLLIEQFATVALGLANHVYVMEGGRRRVSGAGGGARGKAEQVPPPALRRGSPRGGGGRGAAGTASGPRLRLRRAGPGQAGLLVITAAESDQHLDGPGCSIGHALDRLPGAGEREPVREQPGYRLPVGPHQPDRGAE